MMVRTALLADMSVPGDPQGTFGMRDVTIEQLSVVAALDDLSGRCVLDLVHEPFSQRSQSLRQHRSSLGNLIEQPS